MAIEFAQPQSGPNAETAARSYGALQTTLATQPTQRDVFGAQQQANQQAFGAQVQVNRDVFGAQNQINQQVYQTQQQANRDAAQQQAQAEQQQQQFQNQSQMQQQQADLQAQLQDAQLSQGETLRMQRLQNTDDWLQNESGLEGEDLQNAMIQVHTGLDPLRQRQAKAQAVASELQLQSLQQSQGLSDAMGIEGDSARAEAWMRRNSFVDPASGTRYAQDQHGNLVGSWDDETGEYVPFTIQERREQAAHQQRMADAVRAARDDKDEAKVNANAATQETARQTQLATVQANANRDVRNEYQRYVGRPPAQQSQPPPRWLQSILDTYNEFLPQEDGTPWTAANIPADEMQSLMSQEADERVRSTHSALLRPQASQGASGGASAGPAAQGNTPAQQQPQEAPYLPPEVASRPSSIPADRVSELATSSRAALNDPHNFQYMRNLLPLITLYEQVNSEQRPLTIAERAQAETLVRGLRTAGATALAASLTPLRGAR